VLDEMPSSLLEPDPALFHAVDITVATDDQEFAGHHSGKQWIGMRGFGPEIQEEEARLGTGHFASAADSVWIVCWREYMHHVRNEKNIVACQEGIGEEISPRMVTRSANWILQSFSRARIKKRALQTRVELRNR
jgi:hypothetical protein